MIRDALTRLRQDTPGKAAPAKRVKRAKAAPPKKKMTEAEFDQHLLKIGLMSQLPDTAADFDDPDDSRSPSRGSLSPRPSSASAADMADYFFDISALVKRHVDETGAPGSVLLTRVKAGHTLYIARG